MRKILNLILVVVLILAILPAITIIPVIRSNQVAWAAPTVVTYNSTPAGGNWTVPARVTTVWVLVVAGGGGGARGQAAIHHGNAGAGGIVKSNTSYGYCIYTCISYIHGIHVFLVG